MAAPSNWRPCGAGRGGTALWVGSAGDAPRISSDGPPLGVWGEREKLPLARLNVVRLAQVLGAAPSGETGKDGWRSGAGLRAGPAGHATDSMSIDGADLERAVRRNLPLPRAPISHGSASTEQSPGSPGDALAVGGGRGKAHRSTTAVARGEWSRPGGFLSWWWPGSWVFRIGAFWRAPKAFE